MSAAKNINHLKLLNESGYIPVLQSILSRFARVYSAASKDAKKRKAIFRLVNENNLARSSMPNSTAWRTYAKATKRRKLFEVYKKVCYQPHDCLSIM